MSKRKKADDVINPTWIPESRSFFNHVIMDTLHYLRTNSTLDLSANDEKAMCKLETKWREKYNASERMPESSAPPLEQPKAAPRKRNRPAAKRAPKAKQEEKLVDPHDLNDNDETVFRICIPPIRAQWHCRSFDLKVPAYVCKDNLIEPLITWQLLDRIMELPLEEGTAEFQMYVNKLLQLQ